MNTEKLITIAKQYPVAVLCGILSVIMLVLLYLRGSVLDDTDRAYQEALTKVERIDTNEKNAIGLEEDVEGMTALVESINARLLKEEGKADHFRYFLALAEASDVDLSDPVFRGMYVAGEKNTPILTKELSQVEYDLRVQGEYSKVLDFIYRLRTGRKFMRIDLLRLRPDPVMPAGVVTTLTVRALAETPPKEKKS